MNQTTPIPTPITLHTATVQPEWLDYNQHMTEGFYAVAFCQASEAFLDYLDIGPAYRERTGCTIYTVESHLNYLRELKVGAPLRFTTQLLGHDAKRMHVYHEMFHADEGYLAATFEVMMVHVDQHVVKTAPMPEPVLAQFAAIQQAHDTLPQPKWVGRTIQLS